MIKQKCPQYPSTVWFVMIILWLSLNPSSCFGERHEGSYIFFNASVLCLPHVPYCTHVEFVCDIKKKVGGIIDGNS